VNTPATSRQAAAAVPTCPVCSRTFEDCTCTGIRPQVRRMLAEMAGRLETNRPGQPITTIGRHALIQATTMDPALTPALRAQVPEITGQVVRRAYAVQLREIAASMGGEG
jgi:hypothetical protein